MWTARLVATALLLHAGLLGVRADEPARLDALGDPLPLGAYARFGTMRLRHDAKAVAFLDNKTIVSVGSSIRLWDATTGRLIREHRHEKLPGANYAIISADGKRAITRDNGFEYRVWDLSSGKLIQEFGSKDETEDFAENQQAISLAADGSRFVIREVGVKIRRGSPNEYAAVYSTDGKKKLIRLGAGNANVRACAISPDGTRVVAVLETHSNSPDGKALASWDALSGSRLTTEDPKVSGLEQIQFAPDGKALVLVGETSVVLRTIDGKELWRANRELSNFVCLGSNRVVLIGPNGESKDLEARVFDTPSGKFIGRWHLPGISENYAATSSICAVSPDGERLVVAIPGRLRVLNLAAGKDAVATRGHTSGIWTSAVTPDGRFVVSTDSKDEDAILWDVATGEIVRRFQGHSAACTSAACSLDGKLLVSCSSDGTVRIWEIATGRQINKLAQTSAWWAGFLNDNQKVAVVSAPGGETAICDYMTGKIISDLVLDRSAFPSVMYSTPDGRFLMVYPNSDGNRSNASNGFDLWDVRARRILRHFDGYHGGWFRCALSTDLRTLATHGDDGMIRLWEVSTGMQRLAIKEAEEKGERAEWPPAFDISPDGLTIACISRDQLQVDFWDVPSGQRFGSLRGHDEPMTRVDFTPDGRRLITGSKDTTMLGWDMTRPEWRSRRLDSALTDTDLARHWEGLKSEDAEKAFRAKWALAGDPKKTVAFFRERIQPGTPVSGERIRSWIVDLDSKQYSVRERAHDNLSIHFDPAEKELRQTLAGSISAEARNRINRIIDANFAAIPQPNQLRDFRAIEVLEQIGTPEARELLRRLAASESPTRLSCDAAASLKRLEARP